MFDQILLHEFVFLLKCYVYDKVPCHLSHQRSGQLVKVKTPANPCYSLEYVFRKDTPF